MRRPQCRSETLRRGERNIDMTKEMRDLLVDQLDAAKTSEEIDRAMVGGMKAMVDCQFKTSERVKSIAAEREAEKNRREAL